LHHSPTRNMHRSHIDPLPLLADRTLPQLQSDGHLPLACGATSVYLVGWFPLHHFNLTPDGRPWWGPTDWSPALEWASHSTAWRVRGAAGSTTFR
jgi:hypothetical protein